MAAQPFCGRYWHSFGTWAQIRIWFNFTLKAWVFCQKMPLGRRQFAEPRRTTSNSMLSPGNGQYAWERCLWTFLASHSWLVRPFGQTTAVQPLRQLRLRQGIWQSMASRHIWTSWSYLPFPRHLAFATHVCKCSWQLSNLYWSVWRPPLLSSHGCPPDWTAIVFDVVWAERMFACIHVPRPLSHSDYRFSPRILSTIFDLAWCVCVSQAQVFIVSNPRHDATF